MRLNRFYLEGFLGERRIEIKSGPIFHQIKNVLRMKSGYQVSFFNEKIEALYEIEKIDRGSAVFLWKNNLDNNFNLKRDLVLFQSLVKRDKMEWVAQKATEIGVSHIFPVISQRSEKKGVNLERLNKIIIESVEQCGRKDASLISEPIKFKNIWQESCDLFLLGDYSGDNIGSLWGDGVLKSVKRVGVIVGPEGGFSADEIDLARKNKTKIVSLNNYILRSETASVSFLSILSNV